MAAPDRVATGLLALVARLGAGFAQESFFDHLAWAAALWIAGVGFWGLHLARFIFGSDGRTPARPVATG